MSPRPLIVMTVLALAACSPAKEDKTAEVTAQANALVSSALASSFEPASPLPKTLNGVDLDAPLSILGTEPFWNVTVANGSVVFTTPESKETRTATAGFAPGDGGAIWKEGDMDIRLTPGPCSDDMSDRIYRLKAEVRKDGEILKGCADSTATLQQNRP